MKIELTKTDLALIKISLSHTYRAHLKILQETGELLDEQTRKSIILEGNKFADLQNHIEELEKQ